MTFRDFLAGEEIVLLDGAIGTELDKRGLMSRARNNLDAPEAVLDIHRAYAQTGCQALTANTLTMNQIYIETHNVGVSVQQINAAGAKLAKQAAGGLYVLGNISSTGQLLEPYGTYSEEQFIAAFRQQASVLAGAGVDGFIIETVFDLREALCALRACKASSSLPVLVCIAFQTETKGGRTMMGDSAKDCAKMLAEAGADAVGANCGDLDPLQMADVVAVFVENTGLPVIAQPNAGRPELIEDKTVFRMEPEPFAEGIARCIRAGGRIVGGCCGTTPEHIKAVAELLGRI